MTMKLDDQNTKVILEYILSSSKIEGRMAAALYLKTTLSKVYDVSFIHFKDV